LRSPANITTLLLAVAVATMAAGCGTHPPPGLTASVPNVTGVCQHTCTPDPGSPLVDCRLAEGHLEFAQPYIWDFNGDTAPSMYSYTDNTTQIQTFGVNGKRQTWQPPTQAMERCSNPANPTNKVIHIQGGPFLGWGGGVGMAMTYHLGGFPTSPGPPEISGAAIDVSAWEGVSFWARRGPDSQGGIRVLVGDKNTDDDISYRMYHADPSTPRFCERVRECACQNHMDCAAITVETANNGKVVNPDAGYPPECIPAHAPIPMTAEMSYCGAPQVLSGGALGSSGTTQCNTCLETRCDEPYPAYPDDTATPGTGDGGVPDAGTAPLGTDRQFWRKHCTPFQYRNGVSSAFCYDPATEKPAEPNEQCGDHWTTPVNLTNEWRLYLVPFTSMTQQGWAKKFAALDLTAVSVVRFTWDGGWIDYYIDDVTFYRYKRDAAAP
jgi:hypothetical protein